jgi:hypothetical protein
MRYERVIKDGNVVQISPHWSYTTWRTLLALAGNDRVSLEKIGEFVYGYCDDLYKTRVIVNRLRRKLETEIEPLQNCYLLKEDVYIE